jgi:mRNA-degrading endonuclease YafQ of YafQ-DinJ toxin-antitoxin module
MQIVKYTNRFRRDYRREKSGLLGKRLRRILMEVVNLLATDQPLPRRYSITHSRGNGEISVIAMSGPISS